jgi:hypothetical protein
MSSEMREFPARQQIAKDFDSDRSFLHGLLNALAHWLSITDVLTDKTFRRATDCDRRSAVP